MFSARSFRHFVSAAAAVGMLVLSAGTAHATSIVVNGGFETASFSGWTSGGNNGFDGVFCGGGAPEGNCQAFFGAVGSPSSLSQNLTTVAGTVYQITFALAAGGDVPSSFRAMFDGVTLIALTNPNTGGVFQTFSFLATATAATTALTFNNLRDDPGFFFLDAVAVEAQAAAPVPEPATLSLMGIGLAGLVLRRRVRR